YGEVRAFAPVQGARAAPGAAGPLQRGVLGDDLDQVGALPDLLDQGVRYGHQSNSATVTPVPPSNRSPGRKRVTRGSACSSSCTRARSAPIPLPWITRKDGNPDISAA